MKLVNKKARFDYEIVSSIESGIVLKGSEVKAIRGKQVDFTSAYVKILQNEAYLINLHIGAKDLDDTRRTRKLLLHKKEIISLQSKLNQLKLTVIPVCLYTKGRKIKLELGLAKSKKKHDKKRTIQLRDVERDIDRELKDMGTN